MDSVEVQAVADHVERPNGKLLSELQAIKAETDHDQDVVLNALADAETVLEFSQPVG